MEHLLPVLVDVVFFFYEKIYFHSMSSTNNTMIDKDFSAMQITDSSRKSSSKNFCGKCIPESLFLAAEDDGQIDLDFLYRYDRSQIEVRQCQSMYFRSFCFSIRVIFFIEKVKFANQFKRKFFILSFFFVCLSM